MSFGDTFRRWTAIVGLGVLSACATGGEGEPVRDEEPSSRETVEVSALDETSMPDLGDLASLPDGVADPIAGDDRGDETEADIGDVPGDWSEPPVAAWIEIGLPFSKDHVFKGLWAASAHALFVVGAGPIAYRFDGILFEDLAPPSQPEVLNAAWGFGPWDLTSVGMRGSVLQWTGASSGAGGWSGGAIPDAPTLFGVSGTSENDVYAVGAAGAIFRWDGHSWKRISVAGRRVLRGLCHDPKSGLWAVGGGGTILHKEGGVFVERPSPVQADWMGCAAGGLAVGTNGQAIRLDTNEALSLGSLVHSDLTAVTSLPDGHAWAVGLDGQVVEIRPNGQVVVTSVAKGKDLYAVHATSVLSVWAVGEAGVAVRHNGSVWIPQDTGVFSTLYGFHASGVSQGMAVGQGGVAALLQDGTFTPISTGSTRNLHAVYLFSADEGIAVGARGTILRWSSGSFSTQESPTSRDLYAIAVDGDGRPWVSGDGVILSRADDGSWRVAFSTTEEDLRGVFAFDGSLVLAVGKAGAIYRYDGRNWARWPVEEVPVEGGGTVPFTATLYGVFASTPDDLWAVGESGYVLRSEGGPFRVFRVDSDATLRSVHGTGKTSVLIVGGRGTAFYYDGLGFRREVTNTVATLYGVFQAADGFAFAVGDTGTVLMRTP